MKISILLEAFEPEFWGGREARWSRLLPEITKNHEVTIFGDFTRTEPLTAFPNIECVFVNIGPLPDIYSAKGTRSLKHAFVYTWQSRKLLRYETDLILTDQAPLISIPILRVVSFLLRSDFSVNWHEIWSLGTWNRYSKRTGFLGVILQTVALITSKNIIVPSELVFNDLQHKFFSKHATIIPNGIDISANTTAQDKEKINRNFIKLLYVGRLIKHKNTDFLLQIMSQSVNEARNWHLTIVGAGPMRSELVSSIKKLNLEEWVTIESNVSNINLKTHYRTSDVFVFPSEREGFGISVSEALSNNLPVIVYDVPENASISMISSDIFGCKISSLNPQSWVSAIIDILDRDSNKEAGPLVLGLPSWKSVSEQYRNYLEALQNNH